MPTRLPFAAILVLVGFALAAPTPAEAQFKKLKDAAKEAVEDETANQVDRLMREAVRCALDDPRCRDDAEADGKPVIYTDDEGKVITDDEGAPITDHDRAAARAGKPAAGGAGAPAADAPAKPGEGVWANYDFVPGDRVLFAEDFSADRVGNFPRRLEFVSGNMEVVEWEGDRYLRVTGDGRVQIALPEALPERFTIEFTWHQPAGHHRAYVLTGAPADADMSTLSLNRYPGTYFQVGNQTGASGEGPESLTRARATVEGITPVRIQVDGSYAKMYLNEMRVANIPNAEILRGDRLTLQLWGGPNSPGYLGDIVVAAGGSALYEALEAEGEVSTRGILFAVNSAALRPESTPVLREIGSMLESHADLRLRIEGHTDSDGDEAHNLDLSQRRAAAVKAFLVEEHGVDASRLETEGLGESQPVADNATPEGRQQNRRVRLVKLQ